jgi:rRNA maturation endonuclease Nob1
MEYEISCEVCEKDSQVYIEDNDEMPSFCPMCGSPVEVEEA